jgi:hypothetical protein
MPLRGRCLFPSLRPLRHAPSIPRPALFPIPPRHSPCFPSLHLSRHSAAPSRIPRLFPYRTPASLPASPQRGVRALPRVKRSATRGPYGSQAGPFVSTAGPPLCAPRVSGTPLMPIHVQLRHVVHGLPDRRVTEPFAPCPCRSWRAGDSHLPPQRGARALPRVKRSATRGPASTHLTHRPRRGGRGLRLTNISHRNGKLLFQAANDYYII